MREIKFRLVIDNKIIGYESCSEHLNGNAWFHVLYDDPEGFCQYNVYFPPLGKTIIRSEYTGLKDRSGKEIYEGDILRVWWWDFSGEDIGGIGPVCFGKHNTIGHDYYSNSAYGWYIDWDGGYSLINIPGKYEVVSNIYENPELTRKPSNERD